MYALSRALPGARRLAMLALLATLNAFGAATDIADTPMAVKNNVPPNFMLMLDNSGSMSNIVPTAPYDPAASYLASCPASRRVTAGTSVDLWIQGGAPRIRFGGSSYVFGTASGQKCFDNTATYGARLLADASCSGTPCPGSYLDSDYTGHFLNWYFGAYDGPVTGWSSRKKLTSATLKVETRLEIARTAAKAALDALPVPSGASTKAKVRVGLSTYNGADGGRLLTGLGDLNAAKVTSLKTTIDGLTASGSTPLSETLADIGHYLSVPYTGSLSLHPDAASPASVSVANVFKQGSTSPHKLVGAPASCTGTACPVQYWCQRSYAILMTDGRPQADQALSSNSRLCDYAGIIGSCPTSGSNQYGQKTTSTHAGHLGGAHSYEAQGSDYLDDVAQALYEVDLRPDLIPPPGRPKKNNLRTYTVGFADTQAKNDPLLRETAAQGGGLFLTADNTSTLTNAFRDAVDDALNKDGASAAVAVVNTQITIDNTAYASKYNSGFWSGDLEAFALNTTTGLPILPSVWSAQVKLDARTPSNRNIVTYDGSQGAVFSAASTGLSAALVSYLRGDRSQEGTTFRSRTHLLADIVNAEPVVVKYADKPVVFQGANDGMLHAFNGATSSSDSLRGEELWAYVPRLVLGKLSTFADPNYAHEFYVDATPAVGDVTVSGSTRKILVGGLGKGGRGYYALDITAAAAASEAAYASKVLWEALGSDSRMGYSYGTPLIVATPGDGWVVLVPSGYNNGTDTAGDGRGRIFALNPLTGAVLHVIDTGAGSAATPAGLAFLARPASAAATDTVKFVYGGDLLGNVWRFDLTTWTATPIAALKDAGGAVQPVSTAPVVGTVTANKYFVYVGTGLYLGDSDVPGNTPENASATQTQSMYGIIDDTTIASPVLPDIRGSNGASCPSGGGDGKFVCQSFGAAQIGGTEFTNSANALAGAKTGWYFDLPIANARVVTHPQLTSGGALAVTLNVPTNTNCDPGGSSWFLNVSAANGGAIAKEFGGSDYWPSIVFLGNALASRPVIVETQAGKRAVIRMSDQTFQSPLVHEPPLATPSAPAWRRIYWRELM